MLEIAHLPAVQQALLDWHEARGLRAPWRESRDPYHCLVAATMAQQTQMSRVLSMYERFVGAFPTVERLADASPGEVIRVWRGMGYNTRAIRLHRAARAIAAGGWPRDAAALAKIEGIGPFTAAIIASFAFNAPAACVDTNVRRVLGRLSGEEDVRPRDLQQLADAALAAWKPARWNQALMDYGASVCTPRPKCGDCAVAHWCASRDRYTGARVEDRRTRYRAVTRAAPYEGSPRWYRGRIIDALRDLPAGGSLPLTTLARALSDGGTRVRVAYLRELASALERDGLAVVARGRISLPD
jgi:A/G-specific adenine glycosylase